MKTTDERETQKTNKQTNKQKKTKTVKNKGDRSYSERLRAK